MEKLFRLADIRKLNKQVLLGEISSSRMVEIINEKAYYQLCKGIESFKINQAKTLLKLHNSKPLVNEKLENYKKENEEFKNLFDALLTHVEDDFIKGLFIEKLKALTNYQQTKI